MTRPQIAAVTLPIFIGAGLLVAILARIGGDALGLAIALLLITLLLIAAAYDLRGRD